MFVLTDLQACEPMALFDSPWAGVGIDVQPELDSMGMNRVDLRCDDRETLVGFVTDHWGTEDMVWFQEYVLDRIVDTDHDEAHGRTILIHLNVEASPDEVRTADQIAELAVKGLQIELDVGRPLHGGRTLVCCPLAEEA